MAKRKARRLIALLTDFGHTDHYAGVVKGVIATIAPDVRVVDITHDVAPQNVAEAGLLLWSSHRFFPLNTLFLAIVDPGVGTARPLLVAEISGRIYLAPDNGLLDFVLSENSRARTWTLDRSNRSKWLRYALPKPSATFHGRDILAPIAAHLAMDLHPSRLGDPLKIQAPRTPFISGVKGRGRILHVDRFGNLITDMLSDTDSEGLGVTIGKRWIQRWTSTYAEAPAGEPVLVCGSSGLIEIVVRDGNAARLLEASAGMEFEIRTR